ncbi:hypothetical protein OBBRIDRAFT_311635 [Obba rivulosa]|uniref:Uncharacterized protein n=1 Tax=Obba rivulosa TaxID=1052685 RepID=A0A8E2AJ33_9APHY|nr:hypothetical protein OBBRIDRAFT_311635 [Obba rivulosa]
MVVAHAESGCLSKQSRLPYRRCKPGPSWLLVRPRCVRVRSESDVDRSRICFDQPVSCWRITWTSTRVRAVMHLATQVAGCWLLPNRKARACASVNGGVRGERKPVGAEPYLPSFSALRGAWVSWCPASADVLNPCNSIQTTPSLLP